MTTYIKVCAKCKFEKPITEFNKEPRAEYCKQYYQDNKESAAEYRKQYYQDNKESIIEYSKQYRKDNKKACAEYGKKYRLDRIRRDPLYKLPHNIRSLICTVFRKGGFKKSSRTHEILGCSYEEFKIHIESQFVEGMSWDNHGEWHFDHITPVSWGKTDEEIIALNHYTNFQPLWAKDNMSKGNRYSGR